MQLRQIRMSLLKSANNIHVKRAQNARFVTVQRAVRANALTTTGGKQMTAR